MKEPGRQETSWQELVQEVRRGPEQRFEHHWAEFNRIYSERRPEDGPPPVWTPEFDWREKSNVGRLASAQGFEDYESLHRWSVQSPETFWETVIERLGLVFARRPDGVLARSPNPGSERWLPGASLNCTASCFTARPEQTAVISAGEDGPVRRISYAELRGLVERLVAGLRAQGFREDDAIALYMPMTLECVAIYLAIVRAGCHVVSIADSFSPEQVARRLEIGGASGVVTVQSYLRGGKWLELYDGLRSVDGPRTIVIPSRGNLSLREGDLLWDDLLGSAEDAEVAGRDPYSTINVLFSSGTTGTPKAIPWNHLTPIKCAMDGCFHQDIQAGDVVAWPTNIGWMMGPWLIFASLINEATIALWEGAPTGRAFARFVESAGVTVLGTVPSLVRAWRSRWDDYEANWKGIRVFSSTGEPSNVEDYLWLMSRTGYRAPVIEYCGGTEIGGGYVTGSVAQPASPATFAGPALGSSWVLLDEDQRPVAEGEAGEVFLSAPSIGLSQRLLNADHKTVYFEGCPPGPNGEQLRRHGDRIHRLHRGFFRAQGRVDDTMNLGGVKVSSLEIEQVLDAHDSVRESAAISLPTEGGADRLVVAVVLNGPDDADIVKVELGRHLAKKLNPLFKISRLVVVDGLPRTASNKLMRRTLRDRLGE